MNIKLNSLITDGLQMRAAINRATVAEYVEALKDGATFPPVSVIREGDNYYLTDGFHRLAAAKRLGYDEIAAEITDGDFVTALRAALGANVAHGLRRTNADKRHAIATAWENRLSLFGTETPSDPQVAEMCGVTRLTVFNWRHRSSINYTAGDAMSTPCQEKNTADSPTDRFGEAIPDHLVAAFANGVLAEIIRGVNDMRHRIDDEIEAQNLAFAQVTQQTRLAFANAYHDLKAAAPYCVCRNCRGDGCHTCGKTGFQTKAQYDRLPSELKAP